MATLLDGPNKGQKPASTLWLGKLNSQKLSGYGVLYDVVITPTPDDEEPDRNVYVEVHRLGSLLARIEITEVSPENRDIVLLAGVLRITPFFLATTILAGYFK